MSGKRLISTVSFLNNTYKSQPIVRAYVESKLKEHCDKNGLDAQGAETAEVSGGAKKGGYYKSEPFHLTFRVKKSDGTMISTMNPHTNKQTTGHHFYLANDLPDLQAKAAAWDAARKAAAAKK